MKLMLAALALSFSASSFAETVVLAPGESIRYGATKILCEGQPQPVPTGPVCSMAGPGMYNNFPYNYRLAIDGKIISATDQLDQALGNIEKYRSAGLCGSLPAGDCKLAGPGVHNNFPYNNRVSINGIIVYANDNQNETIETIGKFRKAGLCN